MYNIVNICKVYVKQCIVIIMFDIYCYDMYII